MEEIMANSECNPLHERLIAILQTCETCGKSLVKHEGVWLSW